MERLKAILSTLVLALLLWSGSAAHAVEPAPCATRSSGVAKVSVERGDAEPAGTAKKAVQSHGACHGHCTAVMAGASDRVSDNERTAPASWIGTSFDAGADPGRTIRPPIA